MAEKKKSKVSTLGLYTPEAITLRIGGEDVVVATSKGENAFLNMVLASQGRSLIQRTLAHWKDQDQIPSPKELRDIAGAMKDIAVFSAEVYATADPVPTKDPEKRAEQAEDINFDDLTKPIEPHGKGDDKPDGDTVGDETSETGSAGPSGSPSEGNP